MTAVAAADADGVATNSDLREESYVLRDYSFKGSALRTLSTYLNFVLLLTTDP